MPASAAGAADLDSAWSTRKTRRSRGFRPHDRRFAMVLGPGRQRGQTGGRHRHLPLSFAALLLAAFLLYAPARGHAFGTINGLGQRAEHERIVRAALACPPGVKSDGSCFEPRSLDQLAGHAGTFGAVGAPDLNEFFTPTA